MTIGTLSGILYERKYIAATIIVLTVIAVLAYTYHIRTKIPTEVKTTGIVEAPEVNITSMVSGMIRYECCREGDRVQKGMILVEQESSTIKASLEQAMAGVSKAAADVMAAQSAIAGAMSTVESTRADIENARAGITKARAQMVEAKRELRRNEVLFKENAVARATLDTARTNYQSAVADYDSSQAGLLNAKSEVSAAESQLMTAHSQFASSQANVKQAQANVDFYKAQLSYTVIRSPMNGTLVYKALETGETADPVVTILTIIDQSRIWVRADVEETFVGGIVRSGQATIRAIDKSGRTFLGKIVEINRYGEFATQRDVTRGRQDIKTFRIKIAVDDRSGYLKPGMTVEADIPLRVGR